MEIFNPFKAANHIAAETLLAVRALDLGGNANRRQHLTNGHTWNRFVAECALDRGRVKRCCDTWLTEFGGEMGNRCVMRSTCLANLHHREVEAEGLHLPLKLEEFAVRRAF